MGFKLFLQNESKNIFGFVNSDQDDIKNRSPNVVRDDIPIKPMRRLDTGYIANLLCQSNLGAKQPQMLFFDSVRWGQGSGSIKMRFGTRYDVIIERQGYDLTGNTIWIGKRIFDLNNEKFSGQEEGIALEIKHALEEVDNSDPDSPSGDYDSFARLTKAIAYETSHSVNDPLFFESLIAKNKDEHIVKFGVKGHGLQARNQHRVEQAELHISYNRKNGTIQAIRQNIESRLGSHEWIIQPKDFEFCFVPTQPHEEIVNCLSTVMKYY